MPTKRRKRAVRSAVDLRAAISAILSCDPIAMEDALNLRPRETLLAAVPRICRAALALPPEQLDQLLGLPPGSKTRERALATLRKWAVNWDNRWASER